MTLLRSNSLSTLLLVAAGAAHAQTSAGFSPIPTVTAGSTIPLDSQQFVFLGPTITQLTISYPAALEGASSATGRIALVAKMLNQVKPTVSSTVSHNADGTYRYAYTLGNDATASDAVRVWSIAMPAIDATLSTAHPSWTYSQVAVTTDPNPPKGTVSMSPIIMATWNAPQTGPLSPGASVSGFQVNSPYLPGLTIIYARSADDYDVPGTIPAAVSSQLALMRQPNWMNQRSVGIGPRFPKEWTKDVIAADFKDGITRLVESGALSSSSRFVTSLNAVLDTIIGAAGASIPLDAVIAAATTPMEANIASAIAVSLQ